MAEPTNGSSLEQLALLIEHDIRQRGMATGQPYMTADSVARMLNVHSRTANRAMTLLADRGVLTRRRGAGTFVGPNAETGSAVQQSLIHILVSEHRLLSGFPTGPLARAVYKSIPGCDTQLNVLPTSGAESHVGQILDKAVEDGSLFGAILVGCSRAIQEVVLQRRVPAVVNGMVHAGTTELPSLDLDQFAAGKLVASALVKRGHQKFAAFMRENWLPGDDRFMDGVNSALADANARYGALVLRSLPPDISAAHDEMARVIGDADGRLGVVCRASFFADIAITVANELKRRVGKDIDIAFDGSDGVTDATSSLPHVIRELNADEQATRVVRMLSNLREGNSLDEKHTLVAAKLVNEKG